MGPGGNGVQGSESNNAGAVAAGVIVCLLALGVAAAIAIVIVVVLLRRRQGQKELNGFDNQLYERQMQSSGSINGKSINLLPVGDTKDDMAGDGPHDYAAIPADDAYYEDMNVSPLISITNMHAVVV